MSSRAGLLLDITPTQPTRRMEAIQVGNNDDDDDDDDETCMDKKHGHSIHLTWTIF